ncbi:MAG: dTMP kinase [Boseongicola sp.]|nr:dTMP kinase [Boseongicola sp.]MDE0344266.1 dTMP kinase [Boseongicola sp.]
MNAGRLITFEGMDGCGKSTQARLLAEGLASKGLDVVLTREPGGSPGAEEIRQLLVEGPPERWSAETEILLFTAARRDHLERKIRPALKRGATVISDRFADSTRVYQGAVRPELRALAERLHDAVIGIDPDLTFIIDMDPAEALRRGLDRDSHEHRFEKMGRGFQDRVRTEFRTLASDNPDRCHLIDGHRDVDAIAHDISRIADPRQ